MTVHPNLSPPSRKPRINAAGLAVTIAVGIALAGCGGGSSSSKTSASSVTTSAPSSVAPQTTVANAGSCGADVATTVKQHLNRPDVVDVRIVGGCHDVTIATSLDATDAATGQAICDSAAEVAYVSAIKSITVLAANNRELSIGQKGQSCLAEP
jgi:hypothetical protein